MVFLNQAGFNNAFREIYHCTPAEYRTEMLEKREKNEQSENSEQIMERVEQYLTYNLISSPESAGSIVRELEIDVTKKELTQRNWCRLINVGSASELLRFDVREHVKYLVETLHFDMSGFGIFWLMM